ncbi:hypothetical protein AB833_13550 [Chromatiales bacterium (ex Bugula neritina AB1)]|nr:hypothetical protein AB833_13550 [Chromatiales bacterium (ex Bugula neritina AB1)]
MMSTNEIAALQQQLMETTARLRELQASMPGVAVKNYTFETTEGSVTLRDLFAGHEKLLVIHNMGQACRYCTLWGDGLNPFVPHLESTLSLVMLSKDPPHLQRQFANSRGWRFRMASHQGGEYQSQQVSVDGMDNMPGAVVYEIRDDQICRMASTFFGPGDLYCSQWHFLGLAGIGLDEWTPQYNYWQRPKKMEDGGENLLQG